MYSGVLFRRSAAVAQLTVNQLVAGSNPAAGAMKNDLPFGGSFFIILVGLNPNQIFRDQLRLAQT